MITKEELYVGKQIVFDDGVGEPEFGFVTSWNSRAVYCRFWYPCTKEKGQTARNLRTVANSEGCDYADLKAAEYMDKADLDYSCLPLWCGSKKMIVDRRIAAQIAAHFCVLACDDADYLAARAAILKFAKTSHRADDLGLLDEVQE